MNNRKSITDGWVPGLRKELFSCSPELRRLVLSICVDNATLRNEMIEIPLINPTLKVKDAPLIELSGCFVATPKLVDALAEVSAENILVTVTLIGVEEEVSDEK